jgi:hypothetical protein
MQINNNRVYSSNKKKKTRKTYQSLFKQITETAKARQINKKFKNVLVILKADVDVLQLLSSQQ